MDTATSCPRCAAQARYMRRRDQLRVHCTYCGYQYECERPAYAERDEATRWEFDLRATRNELELELAQIPRWRQRMEERFDAVLTPGRQISVEIDKINSQLLLSDIA